MAVESTPKHRPTIQDIRALRADCARIRENLRTGPAPTGPVLAMELATTYVKVAAVELALGWVLGSHAGGMPVGLEDIQAEAERLRQAAAPATEAEVFGGLAE